MFRRASLRATRWVFLAIALISCTATGCAWPWSRAHGPLPPPPMSSVDRDLPAPPTSGSARISLSDDAATPEQAASQEQVSSRRLPSLEREVVAPTDPAAASSRRTTELADSSSRRSISDSSAEPGPPAPPREFMASASATPLTPATSSLTDYAAAPASAATPISGAPQSTSPAATQQAAATPQTAATPTPAVRAATAQTTEADLTALVARLRALDGADPAIVAQLEDSLRKADPSQLPLLVMQFEAMLDMREGKTPVTTETPTLATAPAQSTPATSAEPARLPTPAELPTPVAAPLADTAAVDAETLAANEYIRQTLALLQSPSYDSGLALTAPLPPSGQANPAMLSQSLIGAPPLTPPSTDTAAQAAQILQRVSALEASLPNLGMPASPLTPAAMSPATLSPIDPDAPLEFTSLPLAEPIDPTAPAAEPAPFSPQVGPRDWQESLSDAIATLESDLADPVEEAALRRQQEGLLHLLYLAQDRHQDAIDPIDAWPADDQAFWTHLLQAMHSYLDAEGTPIRENRAQLTLRELERATGYLASSSRLDVRNLAFCERVDSYGRYNEFAANDFAPNQEVLLYVEVENFQADETPKGWVTTLLGRYQIFDEAGRRVADFEFPAEEETCRNRRRDFFIPYHLYLPTRIMPGRYTLQLTMEDTRGQKFGQGSIDFRIVQ